MHTADPERHRRIGQARLVTYLALAVVLGTVASACAKDAPAVARPNAKHVVNLLMTDHHFTPERIEVSKGETVAFRFKNRGHVIHEAVIGDSAFQEEQSKEHLDDVASLAKNGGRPAAPSPADAAVELILAPGDDGTLSYTFSGTGEIIIGCHRKGHWEHGMRATITVLP